MKMKRFLSVFLTLSLCLGLLPGVSLATGEEANNSPPSGYEQMYYSSDGQNYETTVELHAGSGDDFKFYSKTNDAYAILNDTTLYTITCDRSVGEVGEGQNGTNWRTGNAYPGAEGYIYAEPKSGTGTKYAIKTTVSAPLVGVYDDSTLKNYLVSSARSFEYNADSKPTVHLAAGEENVTITAISDDSGDKLSYSLPEGGAKSVSVTLASAASGDFSTEIFLTLSNGKEPSVRLSFTETKASEPGMYAALNNGQLSNPLTAEKVSGAEGPTGYKVTYTTNQSVTIYYYHPTKTCSTTSNYVNIADVAVNGLTGVQAITLKENLIGTLEVGISLTNSDGTSGGGFPIVFSDGYSQMYYQYTEGSYATDIEISPNSRFSLNGSNLFTDNQGNTAITVTNYTFTLSDSALGGIVPPEGPEAWDTNSATVDTSGYLFAVNKSDSSEKYFIAVSVKERNGSDSGGEEKPNEEIRSDLYATLENGTLSNPIVGVKFADGPSGYSVNYTTGEEKTIYYTSTETVNDGSADDKVSVTKHATSENIYVITLASGCSGTVVGEVTVGNGGFPVVFSDKPYALYNSENNEYMADENGDYTVTCSVVDDHVESQIVYFQLNDSTETFGDGSGAWLSIPNGPTLISSQVNGTVLSVNFIGGTSNASTEVTLVVGDRTYTFDITFTDGSSSGGNQDGDDSPPLTLTSQRRDLNPADIISKMAASQNEFGPVSFEYDTDNNGQKETYYLCTMNSNSVDEAQYSMSYAGASGTEYRDNATLDSGYCMGIWTYDASSNRYTLVSGDTKDILLAAFGNSWVATTYRVSDDSLADIAQDYPSYPAVYSWDDQNGWPLGVMFRFDKDSIGSWRHVFSGTINEQTVTVHVNYTGFFVYESLKETATSVEEANAILQKWSRLKDSEDLGFLGGTSYTLNLKSGVFNGIIYVPSNMTVNIHGSDSGERTVLNGGIGGLGCADNVRDIDFIGCGWWATNWPNDDVYKGEFNYGLFPEKGAEYHDCSFKNFYHAIHCGPTDNQVSIITFGGHRSTFENNFIASYLNSTKNGGGNMTMEENVFRHNGCALWMENTGNDFPMNSFALVRCKFYDNGWDVINLLDKCYFAPGQLFEREGEYGHGKFAGRRDALNDIPAQNRPEKASGIAADVSQDGSGVYTFPVAKNGEFIEFDYTNSNAVIGNANASSWLIPEEDLSGKTITVIQDDTGEDAVIWSFD